jgi:hypothetical protein
VNLAAWMKKGNQSINHDSVVGLVVGRCWLSQGGICVLTDSGGEAGG